MMRKRGNKQSQNGAEDPESALTSSNSRDDKKPRNRGFGRKWLLVAVSLFVIGLSVRGKARMEGAPQSEFDTGSGSRYAYAWVLGSIHEDRHAWKGFFFSVLISANLLRKLGSKADLWAFVRLAPDSALEQLPQQYAKYLNQLGVHVKHLPKTDFESFAQIVNDKFFVLKMTNYDRVMFLDADIIPLTNLDYLFHLSDPKEPSLPTLLKSNLIVATRGEPCNGGMFIAEPTHDAWDLYEFIVKRQQEKGKKLPHPHFDWDEGWGHNFTEQDPWVGLKKTGLRWRFHAGHSDQGLLYYFTKYAQQNVSIAIGDRIQNWKRGGQDGNPQMESDQTGVLAKYQEEPIAYQHGCDTDHPNEMFKWRCNPPYDSIAHFTGKSKPWQGPFDINSLQQKPNTYNQNAPKVIWFRELHELNNKLQLGVDLEHWNENYKNWEDSPLGYMPMFADQSNLVNSLANDGAENKQ